MCGRFTLPVSPEDLLAYFQLAQPPHIDPRYNIAPSEEVLAIRMAEGKRRAAILRWGLIPFWADDLKIGNRTINARAETAQNSPAFRAAFRKRRCIIPAGGFFEWEKKAKEKRPFYIYRRDGKPMAFAGLWERWHDEKEDKDIESCTILTTAANELVGRFHTRMPVILELDDFDLWLDPEEQRVARLKVLLHPADPEILTTYPVSTYVNKATNEGEKCIEPVKE
jgi:putative SOS response-associated peptidase YedK